MHDIGTSKTRSLLFNWPLLHTANDRAKWKQIVDALCLTRDEEELVSLSFCILYQCDRILVLDWCIPSNYSDRPQNGTLPCWILPLYFPKAAVWDQYTKKDYFEVVSFCTVLFFLFFLAVHAIFRSSCSSAL